MFGEGGDLFPQPLFLLINFKKNSQKVFCFLFFNNNVIDRMCYFHFNAGMKVCLFVCFFLNLFYRSLLCFDFPENTTLDEYLKNKNLILNLDTLFVIAMDLIDAILCLEKKGIVHNNITTSSVLIAKGYRVRPKKYIIFKLFISLYLRVI